MGTFLIGSFADSWGRRPVLLLSATLTALPLMTAALVPNLWFISLMLVLSGIGGGPYSVYTFMYLSEVADVGTRSFGISAANICRGLAQTFIGFLLALVAEDWRLTMFLYMGLPFALSNILLARWADESPKFLLAQRRYQEARDLLQNKIAKVNKRSLPDFVFPQETTQVNEDKSQGKSKSNYSYFDLFRYKSLRISLITTTVCVISNFFIFFGVVWAFESIDAPMPLVMSATSIGEIFAYLSGAVISRKFGRKILIIIFSITTVIICLSFTLGQVPLESQKQENMHWQNYFQVAIVVLCRFCEAQLLTLLIQYQSEIFPTPVRSLGNAFVSIVSRIVASFSAIAIKSIAGFGLHPITFLGLVGIPAIFASFFLKETKGCPLPDEIEELEKKKTE